MGSAKRVAPGVRHPRRVPQLSLANRPFLCHRDWPSGLFHAVVLPRRPARTLGALAPSGLASRHLARWVAGGGLSLSGRDRLAESALHAPDAASAGDPRRPWS